MGQKHDGECLSRTEIAATTLKTTTFAFDSESKLSSPATVPPAMTASSRSNRIARKASTTFPRKLSKADSLSRSKDHTMKAGVIPCW